MKSSLYASIPILILPILLSGCLIEKDIALTPVVSPEASILTGSDAVGIEKNGVIAVAIPINNIKEMDVFAIIFVNRRENPISFYQEDCILLDQKGNETKPFKEEEAKSRLSRGIEPSIPLPFMSEVLAWRKEVVTAPGTTLLPVDDPDKLTIMKDHKLRVFLYFKKQSITSSQLTLIVPNLFDEETGEKIPFTFRFRTVRR